MEQRIQFCKTTDGARIAYASVGEGPPIMKAANWLSHLEFDWQSPIWRHMLREFARDHTFIRYDERGNVQHGSVPNHDSVLTALKAALINWSTSGNDQYFQSNWTDPYVGRDISSYQTLDFRVSRQNDFANPNGPTTFSVELVMADGSTSSAVALCKYFELVGPVGALGSTVGSQGEYGNRHPLLPTVRVPLADFTGADLTHVRGIRFVFNGTSSGAIFLANIRLST